MRQPPKPPQHVQVRQLRQLVRREHQVPQPRHRGGQAGLDRRNTVAREEEGADARGEGEVAEDLDVVVGEVEGVVGLFFSPFCQYHQPRQHGGGGGGKTYPRDAEVLNGGDSVACNASKDKKVSISTLINV